MLSYEALADGVTADDVVRQVLASVPAPTVTPREEAGHPAQTPAAGGPWLREAAG
jgi:MoxR-like ATPase